MLPFEDGRKFEEQPDGYSATNAVFFAHAARLAYEDEHVIRDTVQSWGLDEDFAYFDKKDMQGFLAADAGKAVLAFRGTEVGRIQDILADARTKKVASEFGKVHEGFHAGVDLLWPLVNGRIAGLASGKRLWITGHSLGGALAVMAAARFLAQDRAIEGVYSLGQPRVGGPAFVKAFDAKLPNRCFRIINNVDPVPVVPPMFFGFRQVATRVYMTSAGKVIVGASPWKMFADSIGNRARSGFNFKSVGSAEHAADRYIEVLTANLP